MFISKLVKSSTIRLMSKRDTVGKKEASSMSGNGKVREARDEQGHYRKNVEWP